MNHNSDSATEWNITTHVGPMLFNIIINHAFFHYSRHPSSEWHRHATFELHFITDGSGVLATEDREYELVPDSFYLIRAGVYHRQKGEPANSVHRYSCKFEFDIANIPDDEYSEKEIKSFVYILSNTPFFYSRNFSSIKHIVYEIQSELTSKPLGYYTKVKHLFSLLFINIMREISLEANYTFIQQPSETHLGNRPEHHREFF